MDCSPQGHTAGECWSQSLNPKPLLYATESGLLPLLQRINGTPTDHLQHVHALLWS